jgi:hypothetical protein
VGSDNMLLVVRGEVRASKNIKNIDSAVIVGSVICNVHCSSPTTQHNSKYMSDCSDYYTLYENNNTLFLHRFVEQMFSNSMSHHAQLLLQRP